ncbi:hypothetical protein [Cohnella sp. REN36]|uniref:hypothetical protein n=1 Tax=Cohnella sp. REN36 TaxID=2887347 RepID=UPI001D144D45|nr:hypothetical protein [Cohnella sp. REN36]MCC3373493.1 hypothetical protein [Cohnella sp. REN36]
MAPGYIACCFWAAAVILWFSGWRAELAGRLSGKTAIWFLAGWPLLAGTPVFLMGWRIDGSLLWSAVLFVFLSFGLDVVRLWTAIAAGVLVGAIALFLQKLSAIIPPLSAVDALWASALIVGTVSAVFLRRAGEQLAGLTVGLLLAAAAVAWLDGRSFESRRLGDPSYPDLWWMSYAVIRLETYAAAQWKEIRAWSDRKGGQRH